MYSPASSIPIVAIPMSPVATSTVLDRNLAALGKRHEPFAALVRSTTAADVDFADTPQGVVGGTYVGRSLASRHRPVDEAARLIEPIDLVEHAVVVVLGFGLGYHVKQLAERMGKQGVIVVFEPDVALLRAVLERVDHSAWLGKSIVVFLTDPEDRAAMAARLSGGESIIAMGLEFLEHPPSRARLGTQSGAFSRALSDYVKTARTTLMTTLVRAADTARNQMLNLDHYVGGSGVAALREIAAGRPAVVVSAGPSLRRNIHLLAEPGVRDRCVIIAVQTTLKPLLDAGVRPHFVTALDYHEISRRFYEGLTPADVAGVTLVADPKANPVIIDAFSAVGGGIVRCCASSFLDKLLGPQKRDMGELPQGATVAHLAFYLARYLGCNPIAMIGQDLAFTDGLYYAPGTAIQDVWAPELNAFNTMEMMQWQRIARHRPHLHRVRDHHGRQIYTDTQMLTYLQQFERDFSEFQSQGLTVIDATEGGVAKQFTEPMPLADVLERFATTALPEMPSDDATRDRAAMKRAEKRLADVARDVAAIRHAARQSQTLIAGMIEHFEDRARIDRMHRQLMQHRTVVEERLEAFELLNVVNQMAAFKRMKADRRLEMQKQLDPKSKQRAQLDRDLENVRWTADVGDELLGMLDDARALLRGEQSAAEIVADREPAEAMVDDAVDPADVSVGVTRSAVTAGIIVPVDLERGGLGQSRDLGALLGDRTVLQATLERLGCSREAQSIVLLVSNEADAVQRVEAMIDRNAIGVPVVIETCDGSPLGPEQRAIAIGRRWGLTCWRGGLGGLTIFDEVFHPQHIVRAMQQHELTAAVVVGPDWPLVDVTGEAGCDALVRRHREQPEKLPLVFTQSPPGLGGYLVSRAHVESMRGRSRFETPGAVLAYQPHAPTGDPIALRANVQIDPALRNAMIRATADDPDRCVAMASILADDPAIAGATAATRLDDALRDRAKDQPQHLIIELTTQRQRTGLFAQSLGGVDVADRSTPHMRVDTLRAALADLPRPGAIALTFAGRGDALLHPQFDECVAIAREAGIEAIHVRTELRCDRTAVDRLIAAAPDVISIDLHADRAATYNAMMGADGDADAEATFRHVLETIEYLGQQRIPCGVDQSMSAFALPWIVCRMQRRPTTHEDIDSFFDRWVRMFGWAVIESPPAPAHRAIYPEAADTPFAEVVTPPQAIARELRSRMIICAEGTAPIDEQRLEGGDHAGRIGAQPLSAIWQNVVHARQALIDSADAANKLGLWPIT